MNRELLRAMTAEAIGTFALVFAGCGAIMVDAQTHQLGHVGVAISFGLVIMFGIYAVGPISGAHFNPAVTFAFALTRHFPGRARSPTGVRSSSERSAPPRCCVPRSGTSSTSARRCRRRDRRVRRSSGSW
jgi:hypothetical protein